VPSTHSPKTGHDGLMEQGRGEASPGKRGVRGALANKLEADFRAHALVSIIRELMASGFVSRRALAEELNRKGIPTAHGGKWHYTTVVRMLKRQGLLSWGKGARINNGQAKKHAAECEPRPLVRQFVNFRKLALSPSMPSRAS
jgi:Recombinase